MTNELKTTAKDAEGKLQAAAGELSRDHGQNLKGEAKQVDAPGMKAQVTLNRGAQTIARKAHGETD
jgi:uncharacterized protein YjbJ (UPF0337 family)